MAREHIQLKGKEDQWIVDNGCTVHLTPRRDLLRNFEPASGIVNGLGSQLEICGHGTVHAVVTGSDGKDYTIALKAAWVPGAMFNL